MTRPIRTLCLIAGLLMMTTQAFAGSIAIAVIPQKGATNATIFTIGSDPKTTATLEFDLSAIPTGALIESAVLRIVPTTTAPGSQFVRIFNATDKKKSISSITAGQSADPAVSTGSGLSAALAKGIKSLELELSTETVRVSRTYHSAKATASIDRPRLIITWKDNRPLVSTNGSRLHYRGTPEDATPWLVSNPNGALLSAVFTAKQIFTGPVFIGDEIVVVATGDNGTKLHGIGPNGSKNWEYPGGSTQLENAKSWKYLQVDERQRLLAFRNDGQITVFEDFGASGPAKMKTVAVPQMKVSKRPVVSAGGMITFRHDKDDQDPGNYIYALSPLPALETIWRSPATVGKSTAPVLSPPLGQQLVYVIGEAPSKGLSIFDSTTGEVRYSAGFPKNSDLGNYSEFHPPLAVSANSGNTSQNDWVYLAGYGQENGTLDGYTDLTEPGKPGQWREAKPKRMSRCMSPPVKAGTSPVVYCVQDNRFRAYKYDDGTTICSSAKATYAATSNIVADGNGNLFFWQENAGESGVLQGFTPACKHIVAQPLKGLPAKNDGIEVLELRAGPNGIFYAFSNTQVLAIRLTQSAEKLSQLVANTQYSSQSDLVLTGIKAPTAHPTSVFANRNLAMGDLQVPDKADVTCTARGNLSFGNGFRVAKGGVLRCRIEQSTALGTK